MGQKGGEEFNMMISLFDGPMIRMETENDDFSISLFEHDDFSIDLGLKKRRNHQPTLVDPLRTSAERIYTEPPATRLANSCGSSGLHTWFDLKMGYTFPETAS